MTGSSAGRPAATSNASPFPASVVDSTLGAVTALAITVAGSSADVSATGFEFASSASEGRSTVDAVSGEVAAMEAASVEASVVDCEATFSGTIVVSSRTVASAKADVSESSRSPNAAATDIGSGSTR